MERKIFIGYQSVFGLFVLVDFAIVLDHRAAEAAENGQEVTINRLK